MENLWDSNAKIIKLLETETDAKMQEYANERHQVITALQGLIADPIHAVVDFGSGHVGAMLASLQIRVCELAGSCDPDAAQKTVDELTAKATAARSMVEASLKSQTESDEFKTLIIELENKIEKMEAEAVETEIEMRLHRKSQTEVHESKSQIAGLHKKVESLQAEIVESEVHTKQHRKHHTLLLARTKILEKELAEQSAIADNLAIGSNGLKTNSKFVNGLKRELRTAQDKAVELEATIDELRLTISKAEYKQKEILSISKSASRGGEHGVLRAELKASRQAAIGYRAKITELETAAEHVAAEGRRRGNSDKPARPKTPQLAQCGQCDGLKKKNGELEMDLKAMASQALLGRADEATTAAKQAQSKAAVKEAELNARIAELESAAATAGQFDKSASDAELIQSLEAQLAEQTAIAHNLSLGGMTFQAEKASGGQCELCVSHAKKIGMLEADMVVMATQSMASDDSKLKAKIVKLESSLQAATGSIAVSELQARIAELESAAQAATNGQCQICDTYKKRVAGLEADLAVMATQSLVGSPGASNKQIAANSPPRRRSATKSANSQARRKSVDMTPL